MMVLIGSGDFSRLEFLETVKHYNILRSSELPVKSDVN